MSHAVRALLLIRLHAHVGEVLGVQALADHYGISPDLVRAELEVLWERCLVVAERVATSPVDIGLITGASAVPVPERA